MSNRLRTLLIATTFLAASCCAGTDDNSQSGAQAPTFRSKTDVVLVPVLVRNKSGPVEGLTAEQFFVTEDGKPQKIASVELIKTGTAIKRPEEPGQFTNQMISTGPARVTIIAIDMINTPFLDQAFARWQLLKYFASSISANEPTAIFAMYGNGSVSLLHDISSDSAALAQAVQSLSGALPNSAAETRTSITGAGLPVSLRVAEEVQALRSYRDWTSGGANSYNLRRNMEATLSCMRQIGAAFWGAPGRKSFIWVTGSFPFDINGAGNLVSPTVFFAGSRQESSAYYRTHSGALPPLPETSSAIRDDDLAPLRPQFRTLLQQFDSGNMVLYPMDARGLMTLTFEAADAHDNRMLLRLQKDRVLISQMTMETMAKMTGGKACYNKNDIVACVNDATHEAEEYYLLSYYRDQNSTKPGWRKLSVKVTRPDVEVRARSGYFYGNEPADKNAQKLALSMALSSSVPFSTVPFSARFLTTAQAGGKKLVRYQIYIPPETIELADPGEKNLQLELIAVASTLKEPFSDQVAEIVGGNLPPDALAAIHKQGISYKSALKLSPGDYTVRFMVRVVATNAIGSVIAPLKVE